MRIREHPLLSGKWPPTWRSLFGRPGKRVYGEKPTKLLSARVSDQTIILEVEHDRHRYAGRITIENPAFRTKLTKTFIKNVNLSIRRLGSLEIEP